MTESGIEIVRFAVSGQDEVGEVALRIWTPQWTPLGEGVLRLMACFARSTVDLAGMEVVRNGAVVTSFFSFRPSGVYGFMSYPEDHYPYGHGKRETCSTVYIVKENIGWYDVDLLARDP